MDLTLLVSTLGTRVSSLDRLVGSIDINCKLIVVVQGVCDKNSKEFLDKLETSHDIKIIFTDTQGVTISRNIALSNCETKYALFCDDDIHYLPGALAKVISAFENNQQAAFVTFNAIDEYGQELKKYPKESIKHTRFTVMRVGTIELAVRMSGVGNTKFPEDMGAGQEMFCCDEPVFLSRLMDSASKKNLYGYHIPQVLCSHPKLSSGKSLRKKNALKTRWLCFKRMFPLYVALPVFSFFCIKNIKKIF
ncbi:glycosyltransferase family A protein [Enterobacter mori]|uniref:glycosyltransferase family A protein n=1 Tax=Enterobacter mori TaxID=539813 RepID=UPI002FCF23CD